ncbi:MAG: hydroxysqualene dehydroxylase HpnE [Rubrivivax sp.]
MSRDAWRMHGPGPRRRVAVVGAGWAGLTAAVRAVQAGHAVTLYELSASVGGRARAVVHRGEVRDNGQHILIGAYLRTLDLMKTVGVDAQRVLQRLPLALVDAQGQGLRLPGGQALLSFARGVLTHHQWSWADRARFLLATSGWLADGFRCEPDRPVAEWAKGLPDSVCDTLLEPLCVAALNTPAAQASTAVLLRVLSDALFSAPGSADLLLPRSSLDELLPRPALRWLERHSAQIRLGQRVDRLEPLDPGWAIGDDRHDAVILACPPREAARLVQPHAHAWAALAAAFAYEPIITAWLQAPEVRFPYPMLALRGGPAQFAFDLGSLDTTRAGEVSLACSGAADWVDAGREALETALRAQVSEQLAPALPKGWRLHDVMTEKRATFRCTPGLLRPTQDVAPRLWAAGDYVSGPYPATLEGAVRSGESAVRLVTLLTR